MGGILFTNLALLTGLTALGVPILIHLLLKRKKKRLRFSTVQFFLKHDEQSTQKRKLRNLLLLAMRLLIFALLVLAFARPYLPQSQTAPGQRRRQVVFVVDRSASMYATGTEGLRWTRAKEMIRKILSELQGEDRAALISCSIQSEVLSEFAPAPAIVKLLKDLQPTYGAADLAEGLKQSGKVLSFGDPAAATTIYVITDLQRSGCRNLASSPLAPEAEIKLLNVGDAYTPNLAVIEVATGSPDLKAEAVVASFSEDGSAPRGVGLVVDGKEMFSRSVDLSPGASTRVELPLPRLQPGWHGLEVRLEESDSLGLDNVRYQTVFIPRPRRVLVAESRQTKRTFEEESFFVATALDPGSGATNPLPSAFSFEKITPEALASKLTPQSGQPQVDLIILPGLREVPSGLGKSLSAFVQSGGGLMLFLGDGVSANRYNSELRDLLPAQLGILDRASETELRWRIGNYDTNSVLFAAFRLPNSGNLALPEFTTRYELTPHESSIVPSSFSDGVPLIISRDVGQGRVVLVNTSADTSWTDWPKHKSFVPWLHGAGRYLGRTRDGEQIPAEAGFIAGTEVDIELGSAAHNLPVKLQPPGAKEVVLHADEKGLLRGVDLAIPGIYTMRNQSGEELRRLAVNFPAQESDLAAMSPIEFQQTLVRGPDRQKTTLAAGLFGQTSNQKEFSRVLLLAVLALLFIEAFWANRTLA